MLYYNISFQGIYGISSLIAAKWYLIVLLSMKPQKNVWKPQLDVLCFSLQGRVTYWQLVLRYCFMFSSFSSSMSFRDAFTLFDTSFPCEKSLWRSLNVRFSGGPPIVFSWSGLLQLKAIFCYLRCISEIINPGIIYSIPCIIPNLILMEYKRTENFSNSIHFCI